ncbi:GNAT family N-acetyltransferase [Planctomonas psychrotolerans]|uniref:GNAT family N-acetyltransferase n=1 Tax=Planctomonas psychrotolerans TaxID=2528712 RepID=UPI00123BE010|nr:GNAT family N-acetyltransferase [Planctomonas psychrotolerans]
MDSVDQPLRAVDVRGPMPTERLRLRPFERDDLTDLRAFDTSPEVARSLLRAERSAAESAGELERRLNATRIEHAGDRLDLAIELPADGSEPARVIGEVSLTLASSRDRRAELGCALYPDFRRLGYGMEAATRVLEFAFDEVGVHRVTARFDLRNVAPARLATRLGMRNEAGLVHDLWFDGRWVDVAIYGILDVEWAARKSVDGL